MPVELACGGLRRAQRPGHQKIGNTLVSTVREIWPSFVDIIWAENGVLVTSRSGARSAVELFDNKLLTCIVVLLWFKWCVVRWVTRGFVRPRSRTLFRIIREWLGIVRNWMIGEMFFHYISSR